MKMSSQGWELYGREYREGQEEKAKLNGLKVAESGRDVFTDIIIRGIIIP